MTLYTPICTLYISLAYHDYEYILIFIFQLDFSFKELEISKVTSRCSMCKKEDLRLMDFHN